MSKWNVFAASSLISRIHTTNLLGGFNISFVMRTPLTRMTGNMLQRQKCHQSKNEHGSISLIIDVKPILLSLPDFSPEPACTTHCRAKPITIYIWPSGYAQQPQLGGEVNENSVKLLVPVTVKQRQLALQGLGKTKHTMLVTTNNHGKFCFQAKADVLISISVTYSTSPLLPWAVAEHVGVHSLDM